MMSAEECLDFRMQLYYDVLRKVSWSKGFQVGCDWAAKSATAVELARLEVARSGFQFWDELIQDDKVASEFLVTLVRPEAGIGSKKREVKKFWESVLGADLSDVRNHDWIVGFVDGAISMGDTISGIVRNYQSREVGAEY